MSLINRTLEARSQLLSWHVADSLCQRFALPVTLVPLETASVDVVFICDTGHHLHDRVRYYGKLRRALRRGGRLVLVDFYKRPLPVGPPVQEKLSRAETQREAEAAGFRLRASHTFLPHQYFLEFAR